MTGLAFLCVMIVGFAAIAVVGGLWGLCVKILSNSDFEDQGDLVGAGIVGFVVLVGAAAGGVLVAYFGLALP